MARRASTPPRRGRQQRRRRHADRDDDHDPLRPAKANGRHDAVGRRASSHAPGRKEALDEKRLALETRLRAAADATGDECAADDETIAAIAPDDEAGKKGAEAAGHCGAAVPAAQMAGGEPGQPGRPHHKPGGEPGNGTADGCSAGSVNGSAAAAPRSPQVVSTQRFAPARIRLCQRLPFGNVAERSVPKGWDWKGAKEGERRSPEAGQPARTGFPPRRGRRQP